MVSLAVNTIDNKNNNNTDFVLHVELRAATYAALHVGVSKFGRRGTEALAPAINLHTLNLLSAG